uniref:Integrase core domain containing protein n=1 Tax=Solanum tuberosum TaxID=4113 RepID=M1DMJ3_SOLTU
MVRGCPVDIPRATISGLLYGPITSHSWPLNTAEFDYQWDILREGAFQRNAEQAVMVAALVAGLEIDFVRMLLAEIHERAFKTSTTYPFPCLIFQLCRDSGILIWHSDRLIHATGTLDIGLIRDGDNVAAPRKEPQPWMQKLIAESEARMERRMEIMMDRKVQTVNKRLDAFELRVFEQPVLTIDLSSLRTNLANLRADIDDILATPAVKPPATPTAWTDDTVLDALFRGIAEEKPNPTLAKGKRYRSSRTEEEKAQKRQHRQENEAKQASILDEKLRQQRVHESAAGASSSSLVVEIPPVKRDDVSTTESAMIDDVGTTECDPNIVSAGSGKPDTPAC